MIKLIDILNEIKPISGNKIIIKVLDEDRNINDDFENTLEVIYRVCIPSLSNYFEFELYKWKPSYEDMYTFETIPGHSEILDELETFFVERKIPGKRPVYNQINIKTEDFNKYFHLVK